MNESTITRELMSRLRVLNKGGPVIKHADKSIIGLPDISVTGGHATGWVEVKYVKVQKKRNFDLGKIIGHGGPQANLCVQLDFHGTGCLYAIFFQAGKTWYTMVLSAVRAMNYCQLKHEVDLDCSPELNDGKAFDHVYQALVARRKEFDGL